MFMLVQHNVIGRKEVNAINGSVALFKKQVQRMIDSFYAMNLEKDLDVGMTAIQSLDGVFRIEHLYRPIMAVRETLREAYKDEPFIYYTIERVKIKDLV